MTKKLSRRRVLPTAIESPSGPPPLSSAWLRERLGAYRDQAIDDPTPDNGALYLYLQRVAMDKASRVAAATQRAVQFEQGIMSRTKKDFTKTTELI